MLSSDSLRCRWLMSTFGGGGLGRRGCAPPAAPAASEAAPRHTDSAASSEPERISSSFLLPKDREATPVPRRWQSGLWNQWRPSGVHIRDAGVLRGNGRRGRLDPVDLGAVGGEPAEAPRQQLLQQLP